MKLTSSHSKTLSTGWRQQNVRDAVRTKLHVRLFDASVREQTTQLPVHFGLQNVPRLHDSSLSH